MEIYLILKGDIMKKICIGMWLCCAFLQAQINRIVTIDGFTSPQAITMTNLSVFVSNTNNADFVKNGSGFISKLDRTGKIIDLQFIANLNAPRGMAILDNILYVVDIDTLKGFNLTTKKQMLNLPISGTNSLNDIVIKDSSVLLVADSETGLILLIDLKKKSYYTFVAIENNLGTLQNMAIDKKFLYVSTFDKQHAKSRILRINIQTKEIGVIHEFSEKISGIELTENGGIIVASWGRNNEGKLYKIAKNTTIYTIDLDEYLQGPTKFWLDSQAIWIPNTLNHKVQKITPEQ